MEDYLVKPMVTSGMSCFPHFHWISIKGIKPNVPENYAKREDGQDFEDNLAKISKVNEPEEITKFADGKERSYRVVNPVIHNISKELQIFVENFEDRFRKEIKVSKLEGFPLSVATSEFTKTLQVIGREPGVVEMMPYLMEFLTNILVDF